MGTKWLILDCNYLSHRAKHAFKDLSYGGGATGVVYGFLKDIQILMERFRTKNIAFCWDSKDKKRRELYPNYKNKRQKEEKMTKEELEFEKSFRKQMKMLRTVYLKTIGFKNIFQQPGYESDDIIAAICKSLKDEVEGIIVSADHDLYQLITPTIRCYSPRTHKEMTLQSFYSEYGILPEQWAKVKAIAGCSSDTVEGVRGVGEKTAIKYIKRELSESSKTYQSIKENWKGTVLRNRLLVELPLKGTKVPKLVGGEVIIREGWNRVTKKLGMRSIKFND